MQIRTLFTKTFSDKVFLRAASSIAVPVMLQLILTTVTNMVDTMMIGKLGTAAISAVGLANKFFYVFALLIFGVHSGTGLLIAQFFGSHDYLHIRKTFGIGLIINLTASFFYLLAARFAPGTVMGIFTDSPDAVSIGIQYLSTVCFCYPVFAFTSLMSSFLRSTRQVRVPVIASSVSILTNISLNYCLIFGKLGFPELGVKGAAIATVIARLAECSILFYFCFLSGRILPGRLSDFFGWTKSFLRNFASHSLPVILNEMIWGLGTTLYFVAYGRLGDSSVAAITVSNTITDILNTAGNGLSSATCVLLGNELGAGNLKKADDYSEKLLMTGFSAACLLAVLMLLLRYPILSLFSITNEVRQLAARCIAVFSAILPCIFLNLIIIVGILRAGGDTRMCFIIDTAGVWFWAVPMAFLGCLVWKLPIYAVYALVLTEEIIKTATGFLRYRQKVWLKNLTRDV